MKIKLQNSTPDNIKDMVANLLDIFKSIGIPIDCTDRRLERMAKACLAVGTI